MTVLIWAALVGRAPAAEVDGYRRVAVRVLVDQGERPPRYRASPAHFDHLVFFVSPDGERAFARARYFVVENGRRATVDPGVALVEIESIEAHEARASARRAHILRAAAFANAPAEDVREPAFAGDGRVLSLTSRTERAFVQIAVAFLDGIQIARANDFPVHVHLIHEEQPVGEPARTVARRFALGVAHVEPLRPDERALVTHLVELDRVGCDGRLRN